MIELKPDVERTLARSCRDHNELDDMVQETMLRAARFRSTLHDRSRLRSWVLQIAWNVMRDHVRRERRLNRLDVGDGFLDEVAGPESSPAKLMACVPIKLGAHEFDREDILGALGDLLPELSAVERRLYEAYYVNGLGCRRSAECLGLTVQTIKMRLFRLRKKLHRELLRCSMLGLSSKLESREGVA